MDTQPESIDVAPAQSHTLRHWVIVCACPDCHNVMAPIASLDEQVMPPMMGIECGPGSEEYGIITPSFFAGLDSFWCETCSKQHDSRSVEPTLRRVDSKGRL